jgi:hypothetical protein
MRFAAIALLAVVSACGSEERSESRTERPAPVQYRLASAVTPLAPFAPDPAEAPYWDLFRAYASEDYDLRQPRDHVYQAGISACGLLGTGALSENVIVTIRRAFALTQNGGEAVTVAATETICARLRGLVKTAASREAGRIKDLLAERLARDSILLAPAYRNAKIACRALSRNHSPAEAVAAVRSEGERFLTIPEDEAAIRQLARIAELVRCPQAGVLINFGTPDG